MDKKRNILLLRHRSWMVPGMFFIKANIALFLYILNMTKKNILLTA